MPQKVCIVGASIAGCMCARGLQSQKMDITILELKKEGEMRSTTGISLGHDGQQLFNKYVPFGELRGKAVQHEKCVNFSPRGEVQNHPLPKDSQGVITSSWTTVRSLLEVGLDAKTCGYGANIRLRYGCQVTRMQEEKEKVRLTYLDQGNEIEEMFDLVIGADGARSFVRHKFLCDPKPKYTGYVAWRGEISEQDCSDQFERVRQGDLGFVPMPDSKSYILLYAKPNKDEASGDDRVVEWCWYSPCKDPSVYFRTVGGVHAKVAPDSAAWTAHMGSSAKNLPPWISTAMKASRSLSVSQINSSNAKGNVFLGGKVLLIGQACAEIEPYLGKSCDVAARQSLSLVKVLSRREPWEDRLKKLVEEWGPEMLRHTQDVAAQSNRAGMVFRGEIDSPHLRRLDVG